MTTPLTASPPSYTAKDSGYQPRIQASFAKQRLMRTIGARLVEVKPGAIDIALDFRPDLTQQHGYLHAGVITSVLDSACGYAALTLLPADQEVLSVEFKVNLLAPGVGTRFLARAHVTKPGRTLSTTVGDLFAWRGQDPDESPRVVANIFATMISKST